MTALTLGTLSARYYDPAELFRRLDGGIRDGAMAEVREALRTYELARLPRRWLAPYGALSWRAGLPAIGLRLLNGVVRADRPLQSDATDEERAEYALCLLRAGATEEAEVLLETVDGERCPRATLYRAFLHMRRWEYDVAAPLFERYARRPGTPEYPRLVALVNLAASLVARKGDRAVTPLLRYLLHETSLHRHRLLHANLLEIAAQHFLARKSWTEVDRCLGLAAGLLSREAGLSAFFVEKWRALAALERNGPGPEAEGALRALRALAAGHRHWETLRQCDEIEARLTGEETLLAKLAFGTPFDAYRRSIAASIPESFDWRLGGPGAGPVLDLVSGGVVPHTALSSRAQRAVLKPGQQLHRLLLVLASDFYRPLRLATVHFQLYPGEYYNPVTAPYRVYNAVKRLREWLAAARLPLVVGEREGAYRLEATAPCTLRLGRPRPKASKHALALLRLRQALGRREFDIQDARHALAAPARTVRRLLGHACDEGALTRLGRGKGTRYVFAGTSEAS